LETFITSSVALGLGTGSLTWVERHDGAWWGMFANYDGRGGEAPRATATPPWSVSTISGGAESWALLAAILERIAPMSISGGRWGPDGRFYLSPTTTPALCRRDPAGRRRARPCGDPGHGGRGSGDRLGRTTPGMLYGITRRTREILAMKEPDSNLSGC